MWQITQLFIICPDVLVKKRKRKTLVKISIRNTLSINLLTEKKKSRKSKQKRRGAFLGGNGKGKMFNLKFL